jgi:hypothetical protein
MQTMTTDPYRTPAVVETDEQRYRRPYLVYWGLGAINAIGKSHEELERIRKQREVILDQMIALGRTLDRRSLAMTQHLGAAREQT